MQAETRSGVTTVTLEREGATFVVREVPAQVCPNCGEVYVDGKVAAELLRSTEELSRAGTQVDIRRYAAAA
jgi:YgiT-type zinc finger domain-containing protein